MLGLDHTSRPVLRYGVLCCAVLCLQATDEELLTTHSQEHIHKVTVASPPVCTDFVSQQQASEHKLVCGVTRRSVLSFAAARAVLPRLRAGHQLVQQRPQHAQRRRQAAGENWRHLHNHRRHLLQSAHQHRSQERCRMCHTGKGAFGAWSSCMPAHSGCWQLNEDSNIMC